MLPAKNLVVSFKRFPFQDQWDYGVMEIPDVSQNQRAIFQFGFIANGLSFFIDDVGLCKDVGADALGTPNRYFVSDG